MKDQVLRAASRIIIPFAVVYGCYVTLYGHITPGGGFPGGALLAAAVILYKLAWNSKSRGSGRSAASSIMESSALLLYIAAGLFGIFRYRMFLTNLGSGIPAGTTGTLISAGFIPVIGILISLKVANTVIRLFNAMIRENPDRT